MPESSSQIVNKLNCAFRVALSNEPARNQFRVGVDCNPRTHVTVAKLVTLFLGDILGLGVAELPDFIELQASTSQITKGCVLVLTACMPYFRHEAKYRVERYIGQTCGGADRI